MWIIFGNRTRAKPVEGGLRVKRYCAECEAATTWQECEVKDRVHVFFVDLFSMKQRRLVCTDCGEDVDLDEARTAPKPKPAPRALTAKEVKAKNADIEAELAALKKRLKG
ncbi:MAG: hypothetical protein HOO96_19970 [Polyangiaceae bacterium]|nr:hypothetical protein [Polyangiaceae bacterium]